MKVGAILAHVSGFVLPLAAMADDAAATMNEQVDAATLNNEQLQELTKNALFIETFETDEVFDGSRWLKSSHEKYANQKVSVDKVTFEAAHLAPDSVLVLDERAHHYGLAVKLDEPLQVDGSEAKKEMVVQYEVKLPNGLDCGGAYVKLLRHEQEDQDYSGFSDSTPFVLMFGPDKCGQDDKLHLIFQHKNPVSGVYEEKHMMEAPRIKTDKITHLYTAVIRDDNTFEVFVDQKSVKSGSLLRDFLPTVIPEKEIDDPEDTKPKDWVDVKKIRDPDAVKPGDWDEEAPARILDEDATKPDDWLDNEPAMIDDPDVQKPEDWDDEDDGDFVVPQIANPKCADVSGCGEWKRPTKANPAYKGKFYAPYIPNPAYTGEWKPRKIPNPNYFEDDHPARLNPIGALAIEVWTMTEGITFDNFWLGNDLKKALEFAELTWVPKHAVEVEAEKAKKDDEISEEDGIKTTFEALASEFATYANANPVLAIGLVIGVAVLATLATFFLCCASGASKPKADSKKTDSDVEDDEEDDAKAVVNDEKEKTVRQRKKAPKVE